MPQGKAMTADDFLTSIGCPPAKFNQVAKVLPAEVCLALVSASKIENSFERAKAIDNAAKRARLLHPHFFRRPKL
jgi:hypothetical protein